MMSSNKVQLPLKSGKRASRCASRHFGHWAVEAKWFAQAVSAIRDGTFKAYDDDDESPPAALDPLYQVIGDVAIIRMEGHMTKGGSSFGGCSTLDTRDALRSAALDWSVNGILLHISSPGGTVAGTFDLADDVKAVRSGRIAGMSRGKRVDAFIEDLGCSAAYAVASQCGTISANRAAEVGSIGTYCVLSDDTGMQEQIGIKYQVISSAKYKGLGADGKITGELVADVQREIDDLNAIFIDAVQTGRGKKIPDVATVADGRVWVAEKALEMGLIDEIASLDAAIQALSPSLERSKSMSLEQFKAYAAEHHEAVATYIEQGKKAGAADARVAEVGRAKSIRTACGGNDTLAMDMFVAGKESEDATLAVAAVAKARTDADATIAAQAKEIDKLKAQIGTQGAIATAGAIVEGAKETPGKPDETDHKAVAEWEWENEKERRVGFTKKERYVAFRTQELNGTMKVFKK